MSGIAELVGQIRDKAAGRARYMVAIAGAPASGKTTLADSLAEELIVAGETAIAVPMDGFHFDDAVLNARGHRSRKGAPFTFDVAGFEVLLRRIKAIEAEIAIPVFDRSMELSRAAAAIIEGKTRFIVVEGNYLLLRQPPWDRLRPFFDFTIYLDVPREELEQRLVKRWLDHGFDMTYAANWIVSNDMPNVLAVINNSGKADLTL